MGAPDFTRALVTLVVVGMLFGLGLAIGVPWLWDVLIRPMLRALVA